MGFGDKLAQFQTGAGQQIAGTKKPRTPKAPGLFALSKSALYVAFDHHLFDFHDGLSWVQTLWTGLGAVHNRVAAIELERVFERVEAFIGCVITAVGDPAIGLEEDGGAEEFIAVPPI